MIYQVAGDSSKMSASHVKGSSVFDSMDRSKQNKLAATTKLTPSSAPRTKKVLFCLFDDEAQFTDHGLIYREF